MVESGENANFGHGRNADSLSRHTENEISPLDIAIFLAKYKRIVFGIPLLTAVVTAGVTLMMPNIYTGRAVLMPPQQQQSTTAMMLGQLGALAGMTGSNLGIKNPNDMYVGMLRSRTIADALISRFKLAELYEKETSVETRESLAKRTDITSGKDGLIVIEVDDKEPQRAADMANAYVEELTNLTKNLAITEASQRRLFFESQVAQAKDGLAKAEAELQKTQERTGLVSIDAQGKATIEAAAILRAQVAAKEVEMAALRTFATDSNPDMRRTQEELGGLRTQLAKIERNSAKDTGDVLMPTGKIPAAGMEYLRKLRDVKYYETIFELMAKQFELAKVDEARDAGIIQVVDKAVASDRKSKPRRALIVILLTIVASILSLIAIYVMQLYERAKKNPVDTERFELLRRYVSLR